MGLGVRLFLYIYISVVMKLLYIALGFILWKKKIPLWDVRTLNWGVSQREEQYYLRVGMDMCHAELSYPRVFTQPRVVEYMSAEVVFCTTESKYTVFSQIWNHILTLHEHSGHVI